MASNKPKKGCVTKSLEEALAENALKALSMVTEIGKKEMEQIAKWLERTKPKYVTESRFVENVKYLMESVEWKPLKIVKVPLNPHSAYSNVDCLTTREMAIEKIETMIIRALSNENQTARIATSTENDILKAYKVATNLVTLGHICECGEDNPREFFTSNGNFAFSGGKNYPIIDVQMMKERMITIKAHDYLIVVIQNK